MDRDNKLKHSTVKEIKKMATRTFVGPIVVHHKFIYPPFMPQWSAWEKVINVPIGDNMQASDAAWQFTTYDDLAACKADTATVAQDLADLIDPADPQYLYEVHPRGT